MSQNPNRLYQFWHELKRRKVVRVITVYAAASFVILELVSIVAHPFGLPDWTLKFVFVILFIGLVVAVILSWVYDVTPEGIEKTRPVRETSEKTHETKSRLLGWKIATIISVIAIIGLVILNIVRSSERSRDIQTLEKSIAVLPFENWSYADEFSHLGNAISNEIITELYNIRDFRVLGYTSTLQYKDSQKSISEIGQELGVNYIIEGIIERQEDKVNIHVQVIRVKNEDHVWADEFDGEWEDIHKIQDEIAFQVARELKAVLSENEIKSIEQKPTENSEAYNFYLRGNDFDTRSYEEQDYGIAINMYQKAIELDPNFALAYAMLARTHLSMYWFHYDRSPERLVKSKKAIDAAISIDPDLNEIYVALGDYYYYGFLDYPEALRHYEIALRNNEYHSVGQYMMGCVYRRMGNLQKAEEFLLLGFHNDPGSSRIAYNIAETYTLMGDYKKALEYIDISINISPDFADTYRHKIDIYLLWEGNTVNARKTLNQASSMINPAKYPLLVEIMVALDIYEGNYQEAINPLNSTNFEAVQPQFYYYPKSLLIALVYDLMADTEKAEYYYDLSKILLEAKIQDDPADSRLYGSLGISYAGLNQKNLAVQAGKQAVDLLPITKEAYRGFYREKDLARIYVMVGEYDLALEKLDYLLSVPGILSAKLLQLDPIWKPLWDHPGFIELIEKYSES